MRLRNPKESAAAQLCHKAEVEGITSPNGVALLNWQKSGEEIFKRFAQNQMELRQFISGRWEQYLNLPGQISQCRSLRELGELQSTFLSKFASDYLLEAGKLAGRRRSGLGTLSRLFRLIDRLRGCPAYSTW